ncbi:MAG: hypothetical protein WA740_00790, partial [Candidatus Binataceae bacterium]
AAMRPPTRIRPIDYFDHFNKAEQFSLTLFAALCRIERMKMPPNYFPSTFRRCRFSPKRSVAVILSRWGKDLREAISATNQGSPH